MIVELTAARLMTPYFGQSVFVWTNIIGIILAAVAVGNYFGGRLADRCNTLFPLFTCLLLAGVFCLIIPFLIRRIANIFVGEGLHLEEAFALIVKGSFSTALILFAPPVALAGACLPFLVKAASACCDGVGRASGSVYASSTLGSITGTFLSTYLFIEALGSKMTFYVTGLCLILAAATGMLFVRVKGTRSLGALIFVSAFFVPVLGLRPSQNFRDQKNVVFESESRYQYIQAVRACEDPETIHLCINEGLDSFHSIYVENDVLTDGQYYDYYCLLPVLASLPKPARVCTIGLAAGTIARQYGCFFGKDSDLKIDGVELDGMTVEIGRRFMGLGAVEQYLDIYCDCDGRMFLEAGDSQYDVIIIDAYSKQVYIPFHMTTQEFFNSVYHRLREGGIMGMNVNGFSYGDRVLKAIANTAASVFGSVSVARVPRGRNFMVYAVRGCGHVDPRSTVLPERLKRLAPLLQDISVYGITRKVVHDPSKVVLQDDRAPIELLCDADLIKRSQHLIEQLDPSER